MYLGIDFLIPPGLQPYVVEVNLGLPGGAQEYDLTFQVHHGRCSDVFWRIEEISRQVYGKPFREYFDSLPWLESLKPFKLWLDGQGSFPPTFHPALRLEDKWVQYQILRPFVDMPETRVFDPENPAEADRFLAQKGQMVLKRRLGRGGRDFKRVDRLEEFGMESSGAYGWILQEWVDSRVGAYVFSVRSVAFGGRHVCLYANLASRDYSNHGTLAYVESGQSLALTADKFDIRSFSQRSWEADVWFGADEPGYLHHNLYEDEVATAALLLPVEVLDSIKEISVRIERFYDSLDFSALPSAFFE